MADKERSIVPMIMGIVGGVVGLPSSICGGACAVGLDSLSGKTSAAAHSTGDVFLYIGIVGAVIGFLGGLYGRRNPVFSGLLLIGGTVLAGISAIPMNLMAIVPMLMFLIGAIFSFLNKNRPAPRVAKSEG